MKYKRINLLTILILFIVGFTFGCGNKIENETLSNNQANNSNGTTTTDYIVKTIPLPDDFIAHRAQFTDDRIILSNSTRVLELDYNGNEISRTTLSVQERFDYVRLADDGVYWTVRIAYVDDARQVVESINIVCFDKEGNELERIVADGFQFGQNEPLVFPNQFIVDDDHIFIMSYHAAYVVDKAGQMIMEINAKGDVPKGDVDGYFTSLFSLKDGRVALSSYVSNNQTGNKSMIILVPDIEKKVIEETLINVGASFNDFVLTGMNGDALLCTVAMFQDFDMEKGELTLIIDCFKYGLVLGNLAGVAVLSDGSIVVAEKAGKETLERLVVHIPKNAPEEVIAKYGLPDEEVVYEEPIEKQVVTLSTLHYTERLSNYVFAFNRENKYYTIEVWDYNNGAFKYDEAQARLRFYADVTVGKVADINVTHGRSSSSFNVRNFYRDLNEFMDKDDDFDRTDYLPGMFEAMDVDGKIYELFPSFIIYGLQGKTADVGTDRGWTLDEFIELVESKPDSEYIIGGFSQRDFILMMVQYTFINPHTGKPRFDRDEFNKILAIAKRFPVESKDWSYEFYMGAKDGNPLLLHNQLWFESLHDEYMNFKEEITQKGYPMPYGNGLFFQPMGLFGITTRAQNPDGAWEFIKFIMDNYDVVHIPFGESVRLEKLNERIEWRKNYYNESVLFNSPDFFDQIPLSSVFSREYYEQKLEKGIAIYFEVNQVVRNNYVITSIILEEIESYLNGQKSADVVLDIIENRLGIYFAEQQ